MLTRTTDITSLRNTVRDETNAYLKKYFDERTLSAAVASEQYEVLWKTISTFALSGGKRLRPYMTLLAYKSYGGTDDAQIIPIMAAQELLHLSMLIHDDIIDRDFSRYGVKNVSGSYMDIYALRIPDSAERIHFSNSSALMAGDLLLSGAYELCLRANVNDSQKLLAQSYLGSAVFSVVGGELLDTESPFQPVETVDARNIALLKTASYSFNAPLLTGAALAGAASSELAKLASYAELVGIAYQFTDDLLGVFGDRSLTGKSTISDLAEGKRTLLLQHTYAHCSESEKIILEKLIGKTDLTNEEADDIRSIIVSSGAKALIEQTIRDHTEAAALLLSEFAMDSAHKAAFEELLSLSTKRQY